jgi:hypothetical protein
MPKRLPSSHLPAPDSIALPLDLKSFDANGAFEGYASLFGREDLGHDVILPGAFAESLKRRGAAGIRMLFQHDPAEPIGVWDELREDGKGLFARGRLLPDVARAKEVLALLKSGAIDGLSIGFRALAARRDRATGIRRIAKVDLWEISIVTFPMMPEARVARVKTAPRIKPTATEAEFLAWLTRDNGFTRTEAQSFLAHGLKGLVPHTPHPASSHTRLAAAIRAATNAMRP